jgi:hypothetical protein
MGGQHNGLAASPLWKWPDTHCVGGLSVPRVSLDRCRKSRHHQDLILVPSSLWRVAIPNTLSWPKWTGHGRGDKNLWLLAPDHEIAFRGSFTYVKTPHLTWITNSIVHMCTSTLQFYPDTHAHNPFLLQTCARCKLQMWAMSYETVKEVIL